MDLPQYELKRYSTAKRLKLSVDALGNVKVSAPKRMALSLIHEFISDNIEWIESRQKHNKDYRFEHPNLGTGLPEVLRLEALDKTLTVSPFLGKKMRCKKEASTLYLYARSESEFLDVLRQWLKQEARKHLTERLSYHAEVMGLQFNKVFIKNQKTRWGSCSSQKNINLNQNLIFLKPTLVDYLLIHELSHIVYPNHSPNFWRHVSRYDKNYKQHDKLLNKAIKDLPLWALNRH